MLAGIVIAAIEVQRINSVVYFAAATVLIFVAAMLAGRKVQRNLKAKWIATIFAVSMVTFGLIWLLLSALNRKEGTKNAAGLSRPQRHPLIFDKGGRDIDGRGLNRDQLVSGTAVIGIEGHAFAAFFAKQGLSDRSLIGNNVTIGVAVPGAKDRIRFFLRRLHIAQYGDCANGNLGSIGVGKIGAASAVQHLFELGLASH
jgi:hypothetical protein